nr:RHS repeat-associated core domain-containing protein [Streptomyces harenosi]
MAAVTHAHHLRVVQPRAGHRHAVLHPFETETVTHHYELHLRAPEPPDPRIVHTLNVTVDAHGNVLQSVTVAYPRARPAPLADPLLPPGTETLVSAVQAEPHAVYTEHRTTDPLPPDPDRYRLPLPCETRTHELTGVGPAQAGDGRRFTLEGLRRFRLGERYQTGGTPVPEIDHHRLPDRTTPQKRLLELVRTLYYDETLTAPLPLGGLTARALPYGTYTLAWTDTLLTAILGDKATPDVLAAAADRATSGHLSGPDAVRLLGQDAAGRYWRCSGGTGYDAGAARRFFLPDRWSDPFGNVTRLAYDPYGLSLTATTDPLGNRTDVLVHDYRVMAPSAVRDPNGHRVEVRFDALGLPAADARSAADGSGDHLDGFDPAHLNPELPALTRFFVTDDYDPAAARGLLLGASNRWVFHFGEELRDGEVLWARHPPCTAALTRESHAHEQPDGPLRAAFLHTDGLGNTLVRKVQAEPEEPGGPLRWIADGKTVVNNKGNPVKRYEPYFSPPESGHRFEEPAEHGVTSLYFYDAMGRLVRTELPDGSHHRVEYAPWHVTDHDQNDTVLEPGNGWYARMSTSALPAERRAARLAAAHAATPGRVLLDGLGHTFLTIAHNRVDGVDEKHVTFTRRDIEGTALWIQDPRGNRVVQHTVPPLPPGPHALDDAQNLSPSGFSPGYDLVGGPLFERSPDSGDRWMLRDAVDAPLFSWNGRGFRTRTTYDALRRPVGSYVTATGDTTPSGAPRDPAQPLGTEVLVEYRVYGETHPEAGRNLRGRTFQVYDGAGVTTTERYDFKGNPLATARRFARDHTGTPDWSALAPLTDPDRIAEAAEPLLDPDPPQTTSSTYDALERRIETTAPDGSVTRRSYNASGLLDGIQSRLRGAATATAFVTGVTYDAQGRRTLVTYGNGARTTYTYDPFTFRLTGTRTTRPADPDTTASLLFAHPSVVQDLRCTHDPVGNVTRVEDASLAPVAGVGTARDYTYDALYRLVAASGREHSGQTAFLLTPADSRHRDYPFTGARIHPHDLQGLRGYVERYRYDSVGNLMHLAHHEGTDADAPGPVLWRRHHQYALDGNRLLATSLPGESGGLPDYTTEGGYGARYGHDAHGNTTRMPHLPLMRWDHGDRLAATARQVVNDGTPETTYHVYDAAGERARKVTVTATGALKSERRYLGGFEVYREYGAGGTVLVRETLHLGDDGQRVALVETATLPAGRPAIRYQVTDHQESACVELDEHGALVSYEEYHPYGTTAFQTGRSAAETGLKRYRHTGKERDDETGLAYHGARHYAPWLGRWTSCDPAGLVDGPCPYAYARCAPVRYHDPDGRQSAEEAEKIAAAAAAAAPALRASGIYLRVAPAQAKIGVVLPLFVAAVIAGYVYFTYEAGKSRDLMLDPNKPQPKVVPPPPTAPDPGTEKIHGNWVDGTFVPGVPKTPDPAPTPRTAAGGSGEPPDKGATTTTRQPAAPRRVPPRPSDDWLERRGQEAARRKQADEAARQQFFQSGRRPEKIVEKPEGHHIATDKSNEFTPKFETIFERAGVPGQPALSVRYSEENLVSIEDHEGPHGKAYNSLVLRRLEAAVEGKQPYTQEYRDALIGELNALRRELAKKGSDLNDMVTKRRR